jgi:hypothetical protein
VLAPVGAMKKTLFAPPVTELNPGGAGEKRADDPLTICVGDVDRQNVAALIEKCASAEANGVCRHKHGVSSNISEPHEVLVDCRSPHQCGPRRIGKLENRNGRRCAGCERTARIRGRDQAIGINIAGQITDIVEDFIRYTSHIARVRWIADVDNGDVL